MNLLKNRQILFVRFFEQVHCISGTEFIETDAEQPDIPVFAERCYHRSTESGMGDRYNLHQDAR